ncbi:hypothetical protein VIGAN_02071700 [Vigna angularis var. angularis]|uniref:Uncharacterized protein n=1 Tax=Vigna angularis var. angularis TaxID=157739 RepID=A0A0S3RBT7_PHAAN|nr:hypothetical protein VIGAN_02071700 [Vigna angularis var. angularis]
MVFGMIFLFVISCLVFVALYSRLSIDSPISLQPSSFPPVLIGTIFFVHHVRSYILHRVRSSLQHKPRKYHRTRIQRRKPYFLLQFFLKPEMKKKKTKHQIPMLFIEFILHRTPSFHSNSHFSPFPYEL